MNSALALHSSLRNIGCVLCCGGRCLPGASNVSTKSARCMFQHFWAVVSWGLTSLPPERRFSWEPSPYSGQHCTPGGLPRRPWVFSESTVQGCLSLLQTGSPSHTMLTLGHLMALIIDFLYEGIRSIFVLHYSFSVSFFIFANVSCPS